MRGIILCQLQELVLEKHGIALWESALEETGLDGIYTSGMHYGDSEADILVGAISSQLGVCPHQLLQTFGDYLGNSFRDTYQHYYQRCENLFNFLESVDSVIHVEVRKLHPDAQPPRFVCSRASASELVIYYHSHRKMCALAVGMVDDAAAYYGQKCQVSHVECMLHGASSCELRVTI